MRNGIVNARTGARAAGTRLPQNIAELRPGMLVFCARPSPIQACSEAVDDEWRHVGIVVEQSDELFVAGFGRRDKFALMPVANLERYSRVGVASVFDSECEVERAQQWVSQFAHKQGTYPNTSILVALLLSYARTLGSGRPRRVLTDICRRYCNLWSHRYQDRVVFICSTFVYTVVNAAREEPLWLGMLSHKRESRGEEPLDPNKDVLLARWLATPSDIWRAVPERCRCDVEVPRVTVA